MVKKTTGRKTGKETRSKGDYPIKATMDDRELRKRIAEKAYEFYERRDRIDGHDVEDWLEAEEQILAELVLPSSRITGRKSRRRVKGSESG